mgnify:FL=1
MKSKLEYLLRSENLTATTLARKLEIQPSGISHILSGRNKPSFDLVVKILRAFPHLNPDWLMLDSDKIYRDDVALSVKSSELSTPSVEALPPAKENIEISASENLGKNENHSILSVADNSAKRMQRVIVLYSDGSFESFTAK